MLKNTFVFSIHEQIPSTQRLSLFTNNGIFVSLLWLYSNIRVVKKTQKIRIFFKFFLIHIHFLMVLNNILLLFDSPLLLLSKVF